jgi:hypothetical protein
MNRESTKPAQTGDYDLRGADFDTLLIGPVTEALIDADRLAQAEWSNGFPNWIMYRAVYCGDALYGPRLRDWCVAYAIAYCEAGGVRSGLPAEEIGCLAGWDAYYALLNHKWVIAGMDVADIAGVDPKTYRKVRNHVYGAMQASLRAYWAELGIAIRRLARIYREVEPEAARGKWASGRGFAHEVTFPGDGCYIVKAATMSDNL